MRTPTKGHQVIAELQKATAHHRKLRDHAHQQARDHFGRFAAQPAQPARSDSGQQK